MPAVINPIPIDLTEQRKLLFYSLVDTSPGQGPNGDCWEWKRKRNHDGYGGFTVKCGRVARTHRIAYFLATGEDPGEMLVCHTCDNPPCCRPIHLFRGDINANNQDMVKKARQVNGHRQGLSKLKAEVVIEIRAAYKRGGQTYQSLADKFGVCRSNIEQVIKRQTWRHVE